MHISGKKDLASNGSTMLIRKVKITFLVKTNYENGTSLLLLTLVIVAVLLLLFQLELRNE